jgi:hypothetical protein
MMRGTPSHPRKTTTAFRIGATAHPNGRVVQKSAFAIFLGPFDFRLFQQYRRKPVVHRMSAPAAGNRTWPACSATFDLGVGHRRARALIAHAPMERTGMREQKITLGEMRASGPTRLLVHSRTIAAPTRLRSTPAGGRMMSGCPISSRNSPVRGAGIAALTSARCLGRPAWYGRVKGPPRL